MLLEKVDGARNGNVLYRRNLVHDDIHIDPERLRADRELSVVVQATAVQGESWNGPSLLGITDAALDGTSIVEEQPSGDAHAHFLPFSSSFSGNGPLRSRSTSFIDTSNDVRFTETTVPCKTVFVKLTIRKRVGRDFSRASSIIEIRYGKGPDGETVSDPLEVTGTSAGIGSTDWIRIPYGFLDGLATVQIKWSDSAAGTRVTAHTMQLANQNPIVTLEEDTS